MHGEPRNFSFTKLNSTIRPGDMTLTIDRASELRVGDEVFVTATEYWGHEVEKR